MTINLILLFLSGISGIFILFKPGKWGPDKFRLGVAFAGGFLLSITLLHILPDLFQSSSFGNLTTGLLILAGFFLQQFLEYITDGAEHGHFHMVKNTHNHNLSFAVFILLGLSVHSFLEGTILSLPEGNQITTSGRSLLTGIILHKIPASLALASVIVCCTTRSAISILLLSIFALASPIGLILGSYINSLPNGNDIVIALLAIVSGNFLHIATTIVFEGSPGHKFNFQRLLWSIIGASIAVIAELLN